ncbi:MAG: hypothetical protein ACPL06_02505 [Candidatus Anstonellales archaeon]
MAKKIVGKKGMEEKIFLYFPLFSLFFVLVLALFGIKGNYALDEKSSTLMFWSFFFVFLLLPLALQVAWLRKYGIVQVLPIFNAFGGYVLYYILGEWLQFLFFIAATILGMWISIIGKKESEEGE